MGADSLTQAGFTIARQKMVEGQFVPANVIDDAVVSALSNLPRELFVKPNQQGSAYVDEAVEVAPNRYIMAPLLLARLLVLAEIKKTDRILDIAPATGYSTAALAQLGDHVVAVEENVELAEKARELLSRLHFPNTEVVTGSLCNGHSNGAPYDVVLLGGAVQTLPQNFIDQVKDGGRVLGVQNIVDMPATKAGLGKATIWRKNAGKLWPQVIFDASLPLLNEFKEKKEFVF